MKTEREICQYLLFFVTGECLDFNLKDYIIELECRDAVDLYEKAIYRGVGKEKRFDMEYIGTLEPMRLSKTDRQKEMLEQSLQIYFDSGVAGSAKRMLFFADMLYRELSNKNAMRDTYEYIVSDIAHTGNRQMDAIFMKYISIVRNEQ